MPILRTEMRNPDTMHIDKADTLSMVNIINRENLAAIKAVDAEAENIALAVDAASRGLANGGRIFYVGAGTSGRLGVLDASECPPTFGVSSDVVIGIIAGGEKCLTRATESEEDDENAGKRDLMSYAPNKNDTVVGISAAGGAAYVVGALKLASERGCATVSLSSNPNTEIEKYAQINIITDTGPEVIAGSTRMKAGTAQKLVLNTISTCAMIKTGKVYENLMINLKPSNKKLKQRMVGIVCEILKCNESAAKQKLAENDWNIRKAVSGNDGL